MKWKRVREKAEGYNSERIFTVAGYSTTEIWNFMSSFFYKLKYWPVKDSWELRVQNGWFSRKDAVVHPETAGSLQDSSGKMLWPAICGKPD